MKHFFGRQLELERLDDLRQKKTASFIIVKGRRRIGKSRLIKEFSKQFDQFYTFTGLAPDEKTTPEHQLEEFSRQIARQFKTSFAQYEDWSDALWAVGERVPSGKILILFDEISWMGSKDPTFLAKIKNLWDLQLKENDQLIFIVCGSASAWIEENILSSTAFVGRISFTLTLDELPLQECAKFWTHNISAHEKFKILSVTGGVPKYLEEINPKQSAEENIKRLCFTKGGFLVEEFEQMFSGIFKRKTEFYKKILRALSYNAKEQNEIFQNVGEGRPLGRMSEYLWELELAGFVTRDYSWNLKKGHHSELSKYRLSDNYIGFYLHYIEKYLKEINRNAFTYKSLTALPEWDSVMGLQFENLILNNRKSIQNLLHINPEDIVCDNPFFQRATLRKSGCQIDYLIQTKFGTLYVCEIKFSKSPIGVSVIKEIQTKIDALKAPKGFSYRPVLIHVNGVTEDVLESDFFCAILDGTVLLQGRAL